MNADSLHALVRPVSRSLERCELSFKARGPFDLARARAQHAGYVEALRAAGATVHALDELPEQPDAVFVEDPIVVLDEVAIVGRPGAASRAGEVESVAAAIAPWRPLLRLPAGAHLEGGDVMRVGKTLYVGRSARTNDRAHIALAEILAPYGYTVVPVALSGCLHLKTAATALPDGAFLANPAWCDTAVLAGPIVAVPAAEPWAANTLTVGDRTLLPAGFPKTRARLEQRGLKIEEVDVSELQKAEGSVTCLSVVFTAAG